MDAFLGALAFVIGVALVIAATERFVSALLGSAMLFGLSTLAMGVIVGGFDPENLATGLAGNIFDLPNVALGTVFGSAVFLLTLGLGLTAVVTPLRAPAPPAYLLLTLASPLPMFFMMLDNELSRADGLILLAVFAVIISYIVVTSRQSRVVYVGEDELSELAEERKRRPGWFFPVIMLLATGVIVGGSELVGWGAERIVKGAGFSETVFGMIFVGAAVSFEEVARGVIPAQRGHAEISLGNILGTIIFFLLFNLGIMSLVRPIPVDDVVLSVHWPFTMGALTFTTLILWRRRQRGEGRGPGALRTLRCLCSSHQRLPLACTRESALKAPARE